MLFTSSVTAIIFAAISSVVAAPVDAVKECPVYKLVVFPDPFEAVALPGYYLDSANGVAILSNTRPVVTATYSSSGPLGLWGAGPTKDGCPGYSYLNTHPTAADSYSTLTWDAVSLTKWNATLGYNLTKLSAPTSSNFLACKRPTASSKLGSYVLLLETAVAIPLDNASITSADGDVLSRSLCTPTKIRVVPTTSV
ncbi:hypothetical protein FRB90_008601 [Tulasnella sp. 427]|nr:hypothetical protein FRB90_008601 [Tulasnella sp. 427]